MESARKSLGKEMVHFERSPFDWQVRKVANALRENADDSRAGLRRRVYLKNKHKFIFALKRLSVSLADRA